MFQGQTGVGKECRETIIMVDSKKRPGKDLDRIDRNILNELQKDGRISNVELSKRVDFPQRRALSVCVGWKDKGLFRAIRRC
ncbi:AsnC family transcriptional regulator [Escherichia coli]